MLEFRFTHIKRSDDRLVGVLPDADPGYVNYAYQAPKDGGQSFRMLEADFNQAFMKL